LKKHYNFVLASGSPRRHELLKLIVDTFEVKTFDVDETTDIKDPIEMVEFLALKKAGETHQHVDDNSVVIGADTIVVYGDQILGKPIDADEAFDILSLLSDRSHYVYTGFCILHGDTKIIGHEKTTVTFSKMSDNEILDYIKTGESMDKAGAYGIQGYGSKFIEKIDGCYYCVMGFPINRIYTELKNAGLL